MESKDSSKSTPQDSNREELVRFHEIVRAIVINA